MIEFTTARSGAPIVRYSGRSLVSTVDPLREAQRFVIQAPPEGSVVIVIGAVCDYLARALKAIRTDTRALSIHLHPSTAAPALTDPDAWWPGHRQPLFDFLSARISESDALRVSVIEWKPACDAFACASTDARETVVQFVRQNQASLVTVGALGRVWLRNLVCNYPAIKPARISREAAGRYAAAVVVASGPSLEQGIRSIRSVRGDVFVLATGSAIECLLANGITPDMAIVTDGSPFASEQLRSIVDAAIPVAAPLTACRAIGDVSGVIPFIQDSFLEPDLLAFQHEAPITLASHGTVTASAIALLRMLDSWPILVAGLDCAWFAGRSHARPHIAERYRDVASTRLVPSATAGYAATRDHTRVGSGWTQDRSLATYAQWFARSATSRFAPLCIIEPSPALSTLDRCDSPPTIGPRTHLGIAVAPAECPSPAARRLLLRSRLEALARETSDVLLHAPAASTPLPASVFDAGRRVAISELLRYERDPSPTSRRELGDAIVARLDALRGCTR